MTVAIAALAALAAVAAWGHGYQRGRRSAPDTTTSYWHGYTNGETTARTLERQPSPN